MRPVNSVANPGATKLTTFSALDDEKRLEKQERRERRMAEKRVEEEKVAREKRDAAMAKMAGQSWADLSDDEDDLNTGVAMRKDDESSRESSSSESESDDDEPAPLKSDVKVQPVSKSASDKPKGKKDKKSKVVEDEDDIEAILRDLKLNSPQDEATADSTSSNPQQPKKEADKEVGSEETIKASEKLRQARVGAAQTEEEKAKEAKKSNAEKKKDKKEKKMLYGR